MFINLQSYKVLSHVTGAPVKMCLFLTRATYSKMCPVKGGHDSKNRTVEELEVNADCNLSVFM
jgi:hypothetical protein